MSQKIFGLTGFAKSGKSTVAEIFKDFGAKEISFADHLKNTCSQVFDIPRVYFDDQSLKEETMSRPITLSVTAVSDIFKRFNLDPADLDKSNPVIGMALRTPRQIAQIVGTDLLRKKDENIHVNTALSLIKGKQGVFVFSDVRFHNEMQAIDTLGGQMLGIKRESIQPKMDSLHESERNILDLIDSSDIILNNNKDLDAFKKLARSTIWSLIFPGSP